MKNFNTQLVRQIGEHFVVAELGRRGVIATPFAGNVPDIDILTYQDGIAVPVQVKSIRTGQWSLNANTYLDIVWEGDKQIVRGPNPDIDPDLIYAFVVIGSRSGEERTYLLSQGELQYLISDHHKAFLAKHGGIRPRNPKSTHVGIHEEEFATYRDRWDLVVDRFVRSRTV